MKQQVKQKLYSPRERIRAGTGRDIDYAQKINNKEDFVAWKSDEVAYKSRPETKYSSDFETKETDKFKSYIKKNNIKKENLDDRGSIKSTK